MGECETHKTKDLTNIVVNMINFYLTYETLLPLLPPFFSLFSVSLLLLKVKQSFLLSFAFPWSSSWTLLMTTQELSLQILTLMAANEQLMHLQCF